MRDPREKGSGFDHAIAEIRERIQSITVSLLGDIPRAMFGQHRNDLVWNLWWLRFALWAMSHVRRHCWSAPRTGTAEHAEVGAVEEAR